MCIRGITYYKYQYKHWCLFSIHFCTILGIFMSTCNVDVRWFPFDIQKCELKFGSWTYDGWLLDLQMSEADISGYMPNGEWDLVGECSWITFFIISYKIFLIQAGWNLEINTFQQRDTLNNAST